MSISNFFRGSRYWTLPGWLSRQSQVSILIIAALYLAALGCMYLTEVDLFGQTLFLLTLGLVNCVWLAVLRRPAMAAALSLIPIALIIVLSKFKFDMLWMTISFVDVMVVDADTVSFLLAIYPKLQAALVVAFVVGVPLLVLLWRSDPFRVRRMPAALGGTACLAATIVLSNAVQEQSWEPFQGVNHVSNFTRSGVVAISELMSSRWLEAATETPDRLPVTADESCEPAGKPPHIILVLDEASFDITAAPGINVPPGYARHFLSFDGKARKLLVEGSGGPTWYTEYNVLTGLSARSYGRLKFFLTRIAADRVKRGLPHSLRRCGYKTFTLYPAKGAFLSARRFQATAGIERFIDYAEMRAGDVEPDHFYYNRTLDLIERERGGSPLFVFVYTTANHFPWDTKFRPDLTPNWRPTGNDPEVDEYIRRQSMSARDYADFVTRLKQKFPSESFLIVRFGDHQPTLSARILNPSLSDEAVARRIQTFDPQYFTTYYAIDVVNFRPAKLESALPTLDAPYLPLMVLEAAGLPLDASFAVQKRILQRCEGVFYGCRHGAEARIFNRMLIDAGLISGL
jgi:hypothetical protein